MSNDPRPTAFSHQSIKPCLICHATLVFRTKQRPVGVAIMGEYSLTNMLHALDAITTHYVFATHYSRASDTGKPCLLMHI